MEKITVLTAAYNPGSLIYRCIDSVLGQTYRDFRYVIVDNGSSDGTKEVLEEYAEKDSRIQLCRNEDNSDHYPYNLHNHVQTEYFMVLDHDDWLEPDALEKMLFHLEQEDADIVYTRTNQYTVQNELLCTWGIDIHRTVERDKIPAFFSHMYWQLRTMWGALIKRELLQGIDNERVLLFRESRYAVDTSCMLGIAFAAKRLVFLPDALHNYLILPKSDSRVFNPYQFDAHWRIFDYAMELLGCFGEVGPENKEYLYRVYFSAVSDTAEFAMGAKLETEKFVSELARMIAQEHTKNAVSEARQNRVPEFERFIEVFGTGIFSCWKDVREDSSWRELTRKWIELILPACKTQEKDWEELFLQGAYLLQLLCQRRLEEGYRYLTEKNRWEVFSGEFAAWITVAVERRPKELAERLLWLKERNPELSVCQTGIMEPIAAQNLLTKNYGIEFWNAHEKLLLLICANRLSDALELCIKDIEEMQSVEFSLLDVTLNLAAVLEDALVFVEVKKIWFVEAFNGGKYDEAERVYQELLELCGESEQLVLWGKELESVKSGETLR